MNDWFDDDEDEPDDEMAHFEEFFKESESGSWHRGHYTIREIALSCFLEGIRYKEEKD